MRDSSVTTRQYLQDFKKSFTDWLVRPRELHDFRIRREDDEGELVAAVSGEGAPLRTSASPNDTAFATF